MSIRAYRLIFSLHFVYYSNNYYKTITPKKTIQTTNYYNLNGMGHEKCITTFDASGMAVRQEKLSHGGHVKWVFTNDTIRKIKLSAIIEGTNLGYYKFREIYTYDGNNHLTQITTINENVNTTFNRDTVGSILSTVKFKNDEKGQPIEAVDYYLAKDTSDRGNTYEKSTAKYLINKNKVEISFPADSVRNETFFIINYGIFVPGYNEIYNNKGELVSFLRSNGSLTQYAVTYKYDKFGNYTRIKIYAETLSRKGKKNKKVAKVMKVKYEY